MTNIFDKTIFDYNVGLGSAVRGEFPAPFVVDNRPRGTLAYDSNAAFQRQFASATGGYNDQTKLYFDPVTSGGTQRFATAGCFLLKSFAVSASGTTWLIDDDGDFADWTRSTNYDTFFGDLTSAANTSDYWNIIGGTNNANPSSGFTKEAYKQGMLKLKEFVQADFPNVQCIFKNPLHRVDGGTHNEEYWQGIRDADRELAAEDSFFKLLPDWYDCVLIENEVHPTQTAFETYIPKTMVKGIANYFKKTPLLGVFGPSVTQAEWLSSKLRCTVAQDAGTNLTVTSGCEETVALYVGGTAYKPSLITKVNATTLDFTFENAGFDPADLGDTIIGYGSMKNLSFSAPEVIRDNATDPRPLRSARLGSTQRDTLAGLGGTFDIIPSVSNKTFSTDDVISFLDVKGKEFTSSAGRYPHYADDVLFDPDASTSMRSPAFTSTGAMSGFIVLDVPATITNNGKPFVCFGGSTGGQAAERSSFGLYNTGFIYIGRNEANTFEIFETDYRDSRVVLGFNCVDDTNVDIYINGTAITRSFDPHPAFPLQTYMWLFALNHTADGNTDVGLPRVWFKNAALTSEQMENGMAYLIEQYQ